MEHWFTSLYIFGVAAWRRVIDAVHGWLVWMHISQLFRAIAPHLRQWRHLGLCLLAMVCLTGCVSYDVGITYIDQHHGEMTQHIRLDERLARFSNDVTQEWLTRILTHTRRLGGSIQRVSDDELIATIPFNNGADLVAKFNAFFQPDLEAEEEDGRSPQPEISSQLSIHESNFLLVLRNRLTYDLDLRSLDMLSSQSNGRVNSRSLLDLTFSLTTPWGAQVANVSRLSGASSSQQGRHILWTLEPGELNHLDVVFWVPSPLGMGTLIIVMVVAIGQWLRWALFSSGNSALDAPK